MLQNFKQTDLRRDSVSHVPSALQVAARARSERQKACAKVGTVNRAVGVVVSHPLSMREALGSILSVSVLLPWDTRSKVGVNIAERGFDPRTFGL